MSRRICAIVALMLLVAMVLTGCGGCGGAQATISAADVTDQSITTAKEQLASEGIVLEPTMTSSQLNALAKMLAATYSANLDTREMFVAAYRGHNMLGNGFDDKLSAEALPFSADAAKAVIDKANSTAADNVKVTFDYGTINQTDARVIVNALQTTINLTEEGGFFDKILTAIGGFVNWLTRTIGFGSYIVGICIFAIIIEAFMLPFTIKQQKNSIKQASLRPKEMAIRNKYKNRNDQASVQKMQQEIQEFYQRENFSPYSGCLPLLIQMPIIMALYYIVIDPLHYVLGQASALSTAISTYFTTAQAAGGLGGALQQSGNGTIEILSILRDRGTEFFRGLESFEYFTNGDAAFNAIAGIQDSIPNFNIAGVNFGFIPSFTDFGWLLLVPVLTFAVYFLSSKITRKLMNSQPKPTSEIERKQMGCSNVMMDIMMPAMSTYFTFVVPAIVGVYWIFRCLLNMLKQFIISKAMPLPVFTEEDYKAAAREMAGKRPVVKKSEKVGKVRSLHHIDDEDFDDTRDRALARKAAIEEAERKEAEAKKAPAMAEPLKKDDKKDKKAPEAENVPEETAATEEVVADQPENNEKTDEE